MVQGTTLGEQHFRIERRNFNPDSTLEQGLWGGGGLATEVSDPREGDGGTKCYVEGDGIRVVVVKIQDGRIADWKGQVRDWRLSIEAGPISNGI